MKAKVQLLDQNTSNQIAAGEVVEKPMSVVKELVENALDAGATHVDVTIYEGGTEYIRVKDNGSGMDEENARLAVLRHATSKIVKAEDLLTLKTLGFRGEALPSIASVSHFNLLTREEGAEFATSITIDGGENMSVDVMGGDVGTTVTVKDLFYNVPARRKFLRTVSTEGRYINDILSKMALSRPDVHFTLQNNDKEVLNTPGSGDELDVIGALYGKNVVEALLPVDHEQDGIRVKGFISRPTLLKGTRQWQTLFVNDRYIVSRMVSRAIDHAYQSQIPKSGFPFAMLKLTVDTHAIDINVHPQKSEIKFGDEQAVYRAVYHALTNALTHPMRGTENGKDEICFMISTNPGLPMRPLASVASGGELSRIMLAIKAVMADKDAVETLIFDEIDTGISGRTAQKVSEKMAVIARNHQVLCITHLAQIAAMADRHYIIEKKPANSKTVTNIGLLDPDESIRELARILGGAKITETVLESAREMKELAARAKE